MGHQFISYSAVDAEDFAVRLVDELAIGPPAIHVWLDKRELKPGLDWDEQIGEAIKTCDSLLFVMSSDSVMSNSVCKKEWTCALKYKKPVIPLRLHRDAELPFRLEPREYIDFSGAFEPALARLRKQLRWWAVTAGLLQGLRDRLADAKRDLARTPESGRQRVLDKISELEQRMSHQQRVVESQQAVGSDENIVADRDWQGEPAKRSGAAASRQSIDTSASSHSRNRAIETQALITKSWEPEVLERARRDIAVYIGPMAKVIVRRAAKNARTLDELYQAIAAEIPSPLDRQKFLASQPL